MKHGIACRGVAAVFVLALAPTLALAYIDPGNGAYMVQALMTVVAAGIFYLRHPVRTLKAIGRRLSGVLRRRAAVAGLTPAESSSAGGETAQSSQRSEET
jgi:hypothetical protein